MDAASESAAGTGLGGEMGVAREYKLIAWPILSDMLAHGSPRACPPNEVC